LERRSFIKALGLCLGIPAVGGSLLEACGGSTTQPSVGSTGASLSTVRLGYQTNIWGMPLLVAIKSNEFKGVPLQEIQVTSGNKTRDLMVGGQADMGTFAGPTFIVGADKGQLQAITVVANVGKTLTILSRKAITEVAQLKGKKIGMQPGASSTVLAQTKVLPDFGLKPSDYQTVNVDQANSVTALAQGSIDAYGGAVEPYGAMVVAQGIGNRLVTFEKYDLLPVLLCVRPEFAQANHDSVVAIVAGMLRVQTLFQKEPDKAVDIVLDFYKTQNFNLEKSVLKDAMSGLQVNVEITPKVKDYLKRAADEELKLGHISAIPDLEKSVPTSYLEEAKKKLKAA
jgi:ABC-type nitrate/sulfonate/bicarbonate transport system substrate-binding protein